MKLKYILIILVVITLAGCQSELFTSKGRGKMDISKEVFGKTKDGRQADLYTLSNANGLTVKITNYGAIVTELHVPDRDGEFDDIVLGYKSLDKYIENSPYFGAIVGRYANRIADGRFTLGSKEYKLAKNENEISHLHGGTKGFDKVLWEAEPMETDEGPALKLSYTSADGEEGYPGQLNCTVIYTLSNNNELKINYEAKTDKATILNITHHGYFNLAGQSSGDILGHKLMLNADFYTPVDKNLIPTGEIKPVSGTSLDFTEPTAIGARIGQVKGGYDHNFVLNKPERGVLSLAAKVYEKGSGRMMQVFTTEPGIQFYSGNFLDGSNKGKGAVYNKHGAFVLETQHFPDSPNQVHFPSVVLKPGQKYEHLAIFKFSTR